MPEIGPDGWYDVSPQGETDGAPASDFVPASGAGDFAAIQAAARRNQMMIGIALLFLIGATLGMLIWRRKRRESEQLTGDGMSLARGVSRAIAGQMAAPLGDLVGDEDEAETSMPRAAPAPAPAPPASPLPPPHVAEPETEPQPGPDPVAAPIASPDLPEPDFGIAAAARPPVRLDLGVEIGNATRSLMMFAVDFRIDIANRSDHAARDLVVSAKLACAQRGVSITAPIAGMQPVGQIERIGPHQSHRLTCQLQLPLSEVTAMRQGATPLFIPLLHVTIEGAGQNARLSSFVIGSPSAASHGRVHPLPLDGPPGGIPGLRAQLIKAPLGEGNAAAEPA